MSRVFHRPFLLLCASLATAGLIAACGGGGSAPAPAPVTTNLTGSVVKGPVNGANVCAYKAISTGKGDQIGCTTSTSTGTYSLDIQYVGDVVIEATGGTYTDEATHASRTLSEPLQVVISSQGGAASGFVTPLTSVAYSMSKGLAGGVTSTNFGTGASSVASQFQLGSGVNIVTLAPTLGASANAYGKALQALSQYIANGGSFSAFLAWTNPSALQSAFSSAYFTINGSTITFTFTGGSSGGTGGTGGTGGSGGTESCGITVSGTGSVSTGGLTVPFTLPATKICVNGVPAGACSAGNSTLQSLAAGGATPSGNYTLSYTYSYAPGNCTGAIATVNYQ